MMRYCRKLYLNLFFMVLWIMPPQAYAAFNRSGNVITQSGTDANLSGLAGLNGVETTTQADITVYNIGNRRLVIDGNLTIDPEREMLIIGYWTAEQMLVRNNASLTIGQEIVRNGVSRFSEGTAIYFENCPAGFTDRVSFRNNAAFIWNGGVISMQHGKFGFYGNTVSVRINSANAVLLYRVENEEQNQLRQETNDFISQAFTLINGELTVVAPNQQLNGYNPVHSSGALSFSSATPNQDINFIGYTGGANGNIIDVKHWSGSRPIFVNSLTGSQLNCGPHIAGGSAYGVALIYQEFMVRAKTVTGSPVAGATYFIRDTDNGNREVYNREGHVVNNDQDFTYTATTNLQGETSISNILLAANIVNNGGSGINTGDFAWDYRGNTNDASDLFDVNIWSYEHLYLKVPNVQMKGLDTKVLDVTFTNDGNVSRSSVEVSSIAGLSITHSATDDSGVITISDSVSLCDLYDYVKNEKNQNSIEEPSIEQLAAEVSGSLLSVGNYQLVFTAASKLTPCDKFQSIQSDVVSSIASPNTNLEVALSDPNGTFKLIRLTGLDTANVTIIDEVSSTQLLQETDVVGNLNFVTQSNTSDLSILVTKTGFVNWAADLDLTTGNSFNLFINQAALNESLGNPATLDKQEQLIYLSRKILQKAEIINSQLNNASLPTITINSVNQITTDPTSEKQDEIREILLRILTKTTSANEKIKE